MKKLTDALFSPFHASIFLILVAAILAAFAGDAFGWFQPDYQRLCFAAVLGYAVGVLIELGVFSGRRRT
jgi:hypothetical protein